VRPGKPKRDRNCLRCIFAIGEGREECANNFAGKES